MVGGDLWFIFVLLTFTTSCMHISTLVLSKTDPNFLYLSLSLSLFLSSLSLYLCISSSLILPLFLFFLPSLYLALSLSPCIFHTICLPFLVSLPSSLFLSLYITFWQSVPNSLSLFLSRSIFTLSLSFSYWTSLSINPLTLCKVSNHATSV